jgi:hypothetical protein
MAKKGISRIVIAVFGIGVLIAVIVPVMLFVFGVDLNDIVTQVLDPQEIPFPIPDQPIDPNTPSIIEGDEGCIDGECIPIENPDVPFVPPEEEEEIDDAINMTETSTDPPIDQIIDIIFEPQTIQVIANVVKIDSTLQRFNETFGFDIPLASLFVEETTDIDFRNGFIELNILLKTDPDTQINADGTFNIKVGDFEIFTIDPQIVGNGITDENGELKLSFVPLPLEILSDNITFDFDANFDKFVNEEITKVSFIVKSLDLSVTENIVCITTPCVGQELQRNGLVNQEIITVEIFRDDIQIFIEDVDGNQVRSYPQDDRLTIRSQVASLTCRTSLAVPAGETGTRGSACSRCTVPSARTCAIFDAPSLSKINVFDSKGQLVDAGQGTGTLIDVMLLRNANYTVDHGVQDGSLDPFDIETPKSQKDYSYKVYQTGTKSWTKLFTSACSIYCMSWWQESWNGDTKIVSNFPK